MERQIEENLSNEENSKTEQKFDVKEMVDESSQTSSEHHIVVAINFFKSHLDYNIDNLIDDL
jgi:hypothetical protein